MTLESVIRMSQPVHGPHSHHVPSDYVRYKMAGEWFWRTCSVDTFTEIRRQHED